MHFQFEMREPQMCQIVCKISVGEKEAKVLKEKIEDEYRVNMYVSNLVLGRLRIHWCPSVDLNIKFPTCNRILDNLPLVVPIPRVDQEGAYFYQHGFHVGAKGQYSGVSLANDILHWSNVV